MSRNARKRTSLYVRPARIQISLRILAVRSDFSLGAFWIAKDAQFLHEDNDDSDQTLHMLVLVFIGCKCQKARFLKQIKYISKQLSKLLI